MIADTLGFAPSGLALLAWPDWPYHTAIPYDHIFRLLTSVGATKTSLDSYLIFLYSAFFAE
jgi:hypothetical protein